MLDKLTNQDLFILGCLLVLIALVGIVCLIMVIINTKKKKKIKRIKEKEVKKVPDISVSLATNNIPEISKEAPKMEEILNKKEEKKEEVKIKEEKAEPKQEENKVEEKSSIEDVLKLMNADLEKQKYENIDRYEEEQEENAVISYQELLDRKMALTAEKEEEKKEAFIPKFSNSEFISPIFGRVDNKEEQVEMLDEDFLNNLKEFRSNL